MLPHTSSNTHHLRVHRHPRPHAHTPTRPPVRQHRSPCAEPAPQLGNNRLHFRHPYPRTPPPLPLSLHLSIPAFYPFVRFWVSWFVQRFSQSCGEKVWVGGRGCGSRGAGLGRRAPGGGGPREPEGGAPWPPARRAAPARDRCFRPSPGLPHAALQSLSDVPRRKPRSRHVGAEPGTALLGIQRPEVGVQAGARRPGTPRSREGLAI